MTDLRQQLIRSCVDDGATPRAVPFSTTTFHAFRVCQGYSGAKETPLGGRTYDYGRLDATTLEDALTEALSGKVIDHKEHLVIQEISERGIRLHVFAVKKKSTPRYVHRDHVTRAVRDLYADPICTLDGALLRAAL